MADVLDHGNLRAGLYAELCTADGLVEAEAVLVASDGAGLGCTAALAVGAGDDHAVRALHRVNRRRDIRRPQLRVHVAAVMAVVVVAVEAVGVGVLNRDGHRAGLGQTLAVAIDLHRRAAAVFAVDDQGQIRGVGNPLRDHDELFPVEQARGNAVV